MKGGKNAPFRARSLAQREGWGGEGVRHKKHALKGVFYVLDVKGGENAPFRARSLVRREGWQQRSAEHPEHAHMGMFGVFGSREGVRETTNMQNMPLWACFACLGCGVGRKTTRTDGRVFRVPRRLAAVLWSALGLRSMPRVVGAMGLLASFGS